MKPSFSAASIITVTAAAFFLFSLPRTVVVRPRVAPGISPAAAAAAAAGQADGAGIVVQNLPAVPEAQNPAPPPQVPVVKGTGDIPNQLPLANPPEIVKGIYLTGWSAGSASKLQSVINLTKRTELNAVVVDVKDYSGYVSYVTGIPDVKAAGAENEIRIVRPNAMIKQFHDAGIYVIGRITSFQDPVLAKAHPEWALKNKLTGKTWLDNKGLAWMDPAAPGVRNYLLAIAKDAFARGFDELQFDYIRFASDGTLGNIIYPFWDQKKSRTKVITDYFRFLRENLPDKKLSADLFGLATYDSWDDLGIGQVIENAYKYFDYVSPMVYPSHYAPGTLGYKNPAAYPYEVIKYSMDRALERLITYNKKLITENSPYSPSSTVLSVDSHELSVKLRPWLQDFSLGTTYNVPMVKKEIQATYDSLANTTSTLRGHYAGWLLWSAANTYTEGALK